MVTASVGASTPTSGAAAAKEPSVRRGAVNIFEAGLLALVAAHEGKGLTTEEMSRALTRSAKSDSMVAGALENLHAKSGEHKVCAAVANLVCKNRRSMTNVDPEATRTIESAIVSGLRLDVSRAVTILRDVITVVTSVVEHGICEWDDESYSVDPEEHACVQVALNLDGDA